MAPAAVGGAVHGRVVADHQLAVGGGVHVELEGVGPGRDRLAQGQQRARRRLPGAALVGVVEDPALEPRVGHRQPTVAGPAAPIASLGMLDHLFLDAVAALRQALDDALLERQPGEDRLAVDILLGDLVWETSCSLPGEGVPPRVRADLTLDWPTWSQAAWRSWTIGDAMATAGDVADVGDEPPEIGLEVVLRVQRLASRPEVDQILAVLPESRAPRSAPTGSSGRARSSRRATSGT